MTACRTKLTAWAVREMMLLIDSAKQIQAEIDTTFTRAYSALHQPLFSLFLKFFRIYF